MDWEALGAIGEILGAITVVATLFWGCTVPVSFSAQVSLGDTGLAMRCSWRS